MKYLYNLLIGIMLLAVVTACSEDDNTGLSDVSPNNVSVSINAPATVPAFVEEDSVFTYTVSIDQVQTVDVQIFINLVEGTATLDEDFSYQTSVTIPEGDTQATFDIEIMTDDLIEGTETFTLQIGDNKTANASLTPTTITYSIQDYDSDDLVVGLDWSIPELFDTEGSAIDPHGFADLILTVIAPDGSDYDESDGGSAEELTIEGTAADGVYTVVASVFAMQDLGDLGENSVDVDLALTLGQAGVISTGFDYPAAMNSALKDCPGYTFTIIEITKTGNNYTFSQVEEVDLGLCEFVGTYDCDEPGYAVYDITFTLNTSDPFTLTNDNFWDSGFEVDYVLDGSGNVTIVPYEFDGDFGRGEETWVVQGSGTYDLSDASMVVPYTVTAKVDGVVLDDNTHTFTKQ